MLSNKGPRIESCLYQKETQWYLDLMVKRNYHEGDTIGLCLIELLNLSTKKEKEKTRRNKKLGGRKCRFQ